MLKLTKIVATIGPASDSEKGIRELILAGANVIRFNMKHNTIDWHEERIARVQKIADELKTHIGILIDLQGPEIRLETPDKKEFPIKKGEKILFTPSILPKVKSICIPTAPVFDVLRKGDQILIDDGFIELKVVEKSRRGFYAEALDNAIIKHRKGVNLPGKNIPLPSLIADDLLKLDMAARRQVDFVALSFCRDKRDIKILRQEMKRRHVDAMVIAKIESQPALDHLDELIGAADGIMVARGDLGIETPIEQLAYWQKRMIVKCRAARKPVITATQMLQSMTEYPRPTRAEAADVANAVFDLTDAVMLSGESASGKYPDKAVAMQAKIAAFNEKKSMPNWIKSDKIDDTERVVQAAVALLQKDEVKQFDKIVVFTETGRTARIISSFRPQIPIIAISDKRKTVETLTLSFGATPVYLKFPTGRFLNADKAIVELRRAGTFKKGERLLVLHGAMWRKPGMINTLTICEA